MSLDICVIKQLSPTDRVGSGRTVVQSKKATKAFKKPSGPQPTMDQRSFELVHAKDIKLDQNKADNVVPAINRALHREGISDVRVERARCTDTCRPLGATPPHLHTAEPPPAPGYGAQGGAHSRHQHLGHQASQRWKWIRIHNLSLHRYMREVFLSSARSWRQRTAGLISRRKLGGRVGLRSEPVIRRPRAAPRQWRPLSSARRFSTACAGAEPGFSGDGTRSMPTRRRDQTPFAAGAVGGAT